MWLLAYDHRWPCKAFTSVIKLDISALADDFVQKESEHVTRITEPYILKMMVPQTWYPKPLPVDAG
jgi:hypothetical protein